jgi:hypothetical protein
MWDPANYRCTKDASSRPSQSERGLSSLTGVHAAVVKIVLSAVVWFLAVAWLDFSGGPQVDPVLTVVTGFFIMFLTLLLLAASTVIDNPRLKQLKRGEANIIRRSGRQTFSCTA